MRWNKWKRRNPLVMVIEDSSIGFIADDQLSEEEKSEMVNEKMKEDVRTLDDYMELEWDNE